MKQSVQTKKNVVLGFCSASKILDKSDLIMEASNLVRIFQSTKIRSFNNGPATLRQTTIFWEIWAPTPLHMFSWKVILFVQNKSKITQTMHDMLGKYELLYY